MGLSYSQLDRKCELAQMEAAVAANTVVEERAQSNRWMVLQEYCDFNVALTFSAINWYKEFQDFVYRNGSELKRKLTVDEFFLFGMKYRVLKTKPTNFAAFKNVRIKKADKLPAQLKSF